MVENNAVREISLETKYLNDLDAMIRNTPRDCEECVRNYHGSILEKLDSGYIIEVPSFHHRDNHQKMWMVGYAIYNGNLDLKQSNIKFILESEQRKRFDVWYVMKYILRRKLNESELNLVKNAEKSCEELYSCYFDELTEEELDKWYAWKYILKEKLSEWELNLVKSASKSCQEVFHHPLDELTREELKI